LDQVVQVLIQAFLVLVQHMPAAEEPAVIVVLVVQAALVAVVQVSLETMILLPEVMVQQIPVGVQEQVQIMAY
jgi:hypothetical protein